MPFKLRNKWYQGLPERFILPWRCALIALDEVVENTIIAELAARFAVK